MRMLYAVCVAVLTTTTALLVSGMPAPMSPPFSPQFEPFPFTANRIPPAAEMRIKNARPAEEHPSAALPIPTPSASTSDTFPFSGTGLKVPPLPLSPGFPTAKRVKMSTPVQEFDYDDRRWYQRWGAVDDPEFLSRHVRSQGYAAHQPRTIHHQPPPFWWDPPISKAEDQSIRALLGQLNDEAESEHGGAVPWYRIIGLPEENYRSLMEPRRLALADADIARDVYARHEPQMRRSAVIALPDRPMLYLAKQFAVYPMPGGTLLVLFHKADEAERLFAIMSLLYERGSTLLGGRVQPIMLAPKEMVEEEMLALKKEKQAAREEAAEKRHERRDRERTDSSSGVGSPFDATPFAFSFASPDHSRQSSTTALKMEVDGKAAVSSGMAVSPFEVDAMEQDAPFLASSPPQPHMKRFEPPLERQESREYTREEQVPPTTHRSKLAQIPDTMVGVRLLYQNVRKLHADLFSYDKTVYFPMLMLTLRNLLENLYQAQKTSQFVHGSLRRGTIFLAEDRVCFVLPTVQSHLDRSTMSELRGDFGRYRDQDVRDLLANYADLLTFRDKKTGRRMNPEPLVRPQDNVLAGLFLDLLARYLPSKERFEFHVIQRGHRDPEFPRLQFDPDSQHILEHGFFADRNYRHFPPSWKNLNGFHRMAHW